MTQHFITAKRNGHHLLSLGSARACYTCGLYTHPWEDMGDIKEKINKDYSVTNDGFQIVSEKFKDIVEEVGVRDVDFFPLSNGSYVFRPRRVVFLDVTDAVERTKGPCKTCGRLTAFFGFSLEAKIMRGQQKVGLIDIVRSAQSYGSDQFFAEEFIFGEEILEALNDEGLRGGILWYECRQGE